MWYIICNNFDEITKLLIMQFSDLLIIQPRRIPIIWGKKSDKIIIFSRWNYRIIHN